MTRWHAFFATSFAVLLLAGCPTQSGTTLDDADTVEIGVGSSFAGAERSGDVVGATEFNATCQGFFPVAAQHELTIDEPLNMRIEVSGSANAVVRVEADGVGTFCGDADEPLSRFWNRATLNVFVGSTVEGEQFSYELRFIEN
ncbi:MAG: hypothetical protein ACKVS9_04015 [Phycisphaerae bacterium]